MNISLNPEAPLTELYRQARTLASEETARPEEALALSQTSASAFADLIAQSGRGPGKGTPADRRRDQVRRAVIAALQHQTLMIRRVWIQQRGTAAEDDPEVKALLAQATALAEAALKLHREGDAGRSETEYVLHFLRATAAVAATPAKKPLPVAPAPAQAQPTVAQPAAEAQPSAEPPPSVAAHPAVVTPPPALAQGVAPPSPAPVQTAGPSVTAPAAASDIVVVGPPPAPLPEKESPRPAHSHVAVKIPAAPRLRLSLVAPLAVIALVGFAVGTITAPRFLGKTQRSTSPPQPVAVAVPASSQPTRVPVAAVPAASVAPNAATSPGAAGLTPSTPRPTPHRTPAPGPAMVELVFRSEPSQAAVYVNGTLKGMTPLQLEALPGTALTVTVRRGPRIWRGTVRVGRSGTQAVTVRLPQPPPAVAQAPPKPTPTAQPAPTPTVMNVRAHYEGLMAKGVELYQSGWYGPAMARFKQAAAVVPTPRAYLWLGRSAIKAGRFAEARRALERVIAMAPGTDTAREAQQLLNRLRVAERGT